MAQGDGLYLLLTDEEVADGFQKTAIYEKERAAIKARREKIKEDTKAKGSDDESKVIDRTKAPSTGLALSGGGIRSASLALGALQAIAASGGIEGIDYLSTVSGGGYTGCCVTAAMHQAKGEFPFTSPGKEYSDTPAVRHIRDFSNYLIPRGARDVVTALAIFLRGLIANVILVLPFLCFFIWVTLVTYPTKAFLSQLRFFCWPLPPLFGWKHFVLTAALVCVDAIFLLIWAYKKSFWHTKRTLPQQIAESSELDGYWPGIARWLIFATVVMAWLELQPLAIVAASTFSDLQSNYPKFILSLSSWFEKLSPYMASLGTIIAFLSKYLFDMDKKASLSKGWRPLIQKVWVKLALWFVALIMPALLWLLYLRLVSINIASAEVQSAPLSWAKGLALPQFAQNWLACLFPTFESELFFVALVIFGLMALVLNPNATSFFRLYRDRLNKAFIFDPERRVPVSNSGRKNDSQSDSNDASESGDLAPICLNLHEINTEFCPYPIVNASLNIEGSQYANKRGRNADFFIFTPQYVGSHATGYIESKALWDKEPDLDLGTAMAISGAAISANMGSATIKQFVLPLALLNVRLGYWLLNPKEARDGDESWWKSPLIFLWRSTLLLLEAFGWINEKTHYVYLTDGGNLENLGLYELLRRRCRAIIVIDAEADPQLRFPSLITLERYARTDLGVRFDLPWEGLQTNALAVDKAFEEAADGGSPVKQHAGPHCAVCDIEYSDGKQGLLFYFKASLSGDENDLVLDYKRNNPEFPHETTLDQFFGEAQLEAYRALGFHMVYEVLTRKTPFLVTPKAGQSDENAQKDALDQLLAALTA